MTKKNEIEKPLETASLSQPEASPETRSSPLAARSSQPATLEQVTTVLIARGLSQSGAEKLLGKMNDEEKQQLRQSIGFVDELVTVPGAEQPQTVQLLTVTDQKKYDAAFAAFNDRVHKATVQS